MASNIQNALRGILGDGGRAAKFWVELFIPSKNTETAKSAGIICKGSSFPGKSMDTIPLVYKGRTIPLPGQHKYTQTWELTFYLEENHATRLYFMDWMQAMNKNHEAYYISDTSGMTKSIRNEQFAARDFNVYQLNFDMTKKVAVYHLKNCYPINISDITLGSAEVGSIGEFNVTFAYSHFTIQNDAAVANPDYTIISKKEELDTWVAQ